MYKGIKYGLRTLAMAAIAGCGSTESRLENEVIKSADAPRKRLIFEKIPDDKRLDNLGERQPATLELPDDRDELRAEIEWYRERLREERGSIPSNTVERGRFPSDTAHSPQNAIIVGDQAAASDTLGAVDIPQKFSTEPLIPPYEPEFPWKTYALLALGCVALYSVYAAGHSRGKKKEQKKSREIIDGLVKKFGNGRTVDELLKEISPN